MANKGFKKQYRYKNICLITMICLLPMAAPVTSADSDPSSKSMQDWARNSLARDNAWFNAPWTADDYPYQNIRSAIDRALTRGQKPAAVLEKYKDAAFVRPVAPKVLFGYGYADYKALTSPSGVNREEESNNNFEVYDLWEKISPPHTYNYVRLMFLRESLGSPDPDLIGVGKRLLAHNPNDYEVEYALAIMANVSPKPSDRSQAVAYQQDLAQRFPGDPRQYRLLAEIYSTTARRDQNQEEAEKAIAAYQQYLSLAPQYRVQIEENIKITKAYQAMWLKE